jgi:hypothetical protein
VLNRSEIAAPLGVSVPTISAWLGVLETTGHVILVPPFFESLGKRLVKSPKCYWIDSGLVCFLLGIESEAELARSPFAGSVFEGFVASEIVKAQQNRGRSRALYWLRDERGLEVDFVIVGRGGRLELVEAKWTRTVRPEDARPLQKLLEAARGRRARATVVHRRSRGAAALRAVAPGVRALAVEEFVEELAE